MFCFRLTESEFRQLVGNLDEVIEVHNALEVALKEEIANNPQPRIGKVLLNNGGLVKSSHLTYWANHPKAVCVFEKFRDNLDSFMESQGASKPGLMILTTGLSRPFRHLERYAGLMQEVEQHLPDDHPDRGDTQRSIGFYKNVAVRVLFFFNKVFKLIFKIIVSSLKCFKNSFWIVFKQF